MPLSQNKWTANDRSLIARYTVPGTHVQLAIRRGDVATILLHVAARFHAEVEPLHVGWCWGYAERTIRGSTTTLSNHASGTAIDLDAPAHPLGVAPSRSYAPQQIARIHDITGSLAGVVRWGGDYQGRPDGMHFEIDANPAAVAQVAARLRAPARFHLHRTLKLGAAGADVTALQRRLRVTADGRFGPLTRNAVMHWQTAHHLHADGAVGPKTAATLGWTWNPH